MKLLLDMWRTKKKSFLCSLIEGKEKEGWKEGEEGETDGPGRICLLDIISPIIRKFWVRRTPRMENGMKSGGGVRRPGPEGNS